MGPPNRARQPAGGLWAGPDSGGQGWAGRWLGAGPAASAAPLVSEPPIPGPAPPEGRASVCLPPRPASVHLSNLQSGAVGVRISKRFRRSAEILCGTAQRASPGHSSGPPPPARSPSGAPREPAGHGAPVGPCGRLHAVPERRRHSGLPDHQPRGAHVVRDSGAAIVASALLDAGSRLGDAVHGDGVRLLPGLEGAGGLHREGPGAPGALRRAAGPQLGLASLILWCAPNGLGPGGDHLDQRGCSGHHPVLAPREPDGLPPHVPLPGLDGDGHRPELLRLAG